MAYPTEAQKRRLDRKLAIIRKRQAKAGGAKKSPNFGITRGQFHRILDAASQPSIEVKCTEAKYDQESSGT